MKSRERSVVIVCFVASSAKYMHDALLPFEQPLVERKMRQAKLQVRLRQNLRNGKLLLTEFI